MKTRALQKYIYVTITWEIHSNIYIYFQSIYISHITISRKTYTYIIYSLTLFLLCIHDINSFILGRCRCNFKSTIFRGLYHKHSTEHYNDVLMSVMAYQITGILIVCSTICSGTDHRKYQSSRSLTFVRGIHQWPVDSLHKGPVMQKMFLVDDVIMDNPHMNDTWHHLLFVDFGSGDGLVPLGNMSSPETCWSSSRTSYGITMVNELISHLGPDSHWDLSCLFISKYSRHHNRNSTLTHCGLVTP